MKPLSIIHPQTRLQNAFVTALLLCLLGALAALSARHAAQVDITHNAANTLSSASQKLLASLPDSVLVTAYIKAGLPIRAQIAQLVDRYSRYKSNLTLAFTDPDWEPEKARELNIGPEGVIVVEYQGRTEKLTFIDEFSLTNALLQLANANERWVTFLGGHGERSPDGEANFDLGRFGKELARRKIRTQTLNLAAMPAIPGNSVLLVMTAPAIPLLAGEWAIIQRYVQGGGNLLLLTDPGDEQLAVIEKQLGIKPLRGVIVDGGSTLYGIDDPSVVVVGGYAPHPITQGFQSITVYPAAAALEVEAQNGFKAETLLGSSAQSWTETGAIKGNINFDVKSGEHQGPLAFAHALTRTGPEKTQQRIVAAGDGDFLSNAAIGNAGNLDMGLRMILWLIHDDPFIDIPAKTASDKSLQLTQTAVAVIGFGFLIFLPLGLIGTGFFIGYKRKRR